MGGYMGKLARIDLSTGRFVAEEIPADVLRKYIGGTGLARRTFYRNALSPNWIRWDRRISWSLRAGRLLELMFPPLADMPSPRNHL